jgi:hypothetical protein
MLLRRVEDVSDLEEHEKIGDLDGLASPTEREAATAAFAAIATALRQSGIAVPKRGDWRGKRLISQITEYVMLVSD